MNIVALSNQNYTADFDEAALAEALESIENLTVDSAVALSVPASHQDYEGQGPAYTAYLASGKYRGSIEDLRTELFNLPAEQTSGLTVNAVQSELANDEKKLVIMDVDSTLIQQEVIDELAAHAGKREEISLITERAMAGELDFESSLRERVKQLAGVPETVLTEVYERISLTPGGSELVRLLHEAGHTVAVVSGGFVQVLRPLAQRTGLDYARANLLDIKDGALTGEVSGQVITPQVKRDSLKEWMKAEGISPKQVLAVGDGANDILMVKEAALGIAFNAKAALKVEADVQINTPRLDAVRHFIGL